ncbi:MAG: hypothetical protein J0L64_21990 [Acidobacteria bacterium]|nr:hypothetical protein [Acidobacteriota bacterium]
MTSSRWAIAAVLAALVMLGYYTLPGNTFLASDTQIYIPILERIWDPSTYPADSVALRPHVKYSIYDELALLLRRITGADSFQGVLIAQQLATRFCGLLGVYLLGRALALPPLLALLLPVLYGMGATVAGPAVLTLEYEPVPRGSAICLVVLALGLMAHARLQSAALAAGVALLYHPPTTWPFLTVFGLYLLVEARRKGIASLRPLLVIGAFAAGLFVLSRFQAGETEQQALLHRIDEALARLQRLRGSYSWVSLWSAPYIRQYEFLAVFIAAAMWRWREALTREMRWVCGGMALAGLLSIPLSYSLLEMAHWSLMPAFQPARAAAFVFVIAVVLSAAGGVMAAREGRAWEAAAWFAVGFALPASWTVLDVLLPDFRDEIITKRWLIVAAASLATAWGVRAYSQQRRAASLLLAAALLPYFLLPTWGKVVNYKFVDTPDIAELAQWARTSTPKQAMFLFADGAKDPAGSIFRARSLRAVYVDWKGGGQVNLLKEFAEEWWERWHSMMDPGYKPERIPEYAARGIDYIVLTKANRISELPVLFENSRFLVYKIR